MPALAFRKCAGLCRGITDMKIETRFVTKLCLLLIAAFLAGGNVIAQEEGERPQQKTKKAQAVSKQVYDRIQKAQEQIDAENYPSALKILGSLDASEKLTEYERQNVLNYIAYVQYSTDDIDGAMASYKRMLQIESIEEQIKKNTIYTLAQLSTMQENYQDALNYLNQWLPLEPNPQPDAFILIAQNLYQLNRYADMVEPIETAIRLAEEKGKQVKEDWYVLLNFAYFSQEDYQKVKEIQKIIIPKWPKKRYWFALAGAFTELGDDINLLTSYDAAHTQGMLQKESELVTMAQLYMQHEIPYKAGTLLESAMESGQVARDAKNYRILSQAWMLAQEDEKAIPALKEAARLSDEGELFLRLGNTHLNLGQYGECVAAIQNGVRKGGIKSPDNAQISLGMCLYNQQKYREAITAFREAGKTRRSARVARQWINVIESDIKRNEQIRLAEAAARKQQQALTERRRATERI